MVGVDTSEHVVEQAKCKFPHLQFAVLDGNDIHGAAALVQQQQFQQQQQHEFQQKQQQHEGEQQQGGHQPLTVPFSRVFVDISGQV